MRSMVCNELEPFVKIHKKRWLKYSNFHNFQFFLCVEIDNFDICAIIVSRHG